MEHTYSHFKNKKHNQAVLRNWILVLTVAGTILFAILTHI